MAEQNALQAVCILNPDGDSGVSGVCWLTQVPGQNCVIKAEMKGLTPGKHGFHIHQFGNLTGGCKTAGGHYNPHGKTHGGPGNPNRHVGDLGNVEAGADGVGILKLEDDLVQLSGEFSVIGRAMVCHAGEDDLGKGGHDDSLTTGHAGGRVACGVIGLCQVPS